MKYYLRSEETGIGEQGVGESTGQGAQGELNMFVEAKTEESAQLDGKKSLPHEEGHEKTPSAMKKDESSSAKPTRPTETKKETSDNSAMLILALVAIPLLLYLLKNPSKTMELASKSGASLNSVDQLQPSITKALVKL